MYMLRYASAANELYDFDIDLDFGLSVTLTIFRTTLVSPLRYLKRPHNPLDYHTYHIPDLSALRVIHVVENPV